MGETVANNASIRHEDVGLGADLGAACVKSGQHQGSKGCKDFNNIANLFKQTQIARVLKPVVEYSGKHSKELRSLDATIPWDTNLITSASFTRT